MDESENYDLKHHYKEEVDRLSKVILDWNLVMTKNPEGWLTKN